MNSLVLIASIFAQSSGVDREAASSVGLAIPPGSIIMDATFNDWRDIPPTLRDPSDAEHSPVDFGEVRVAHDDRFIYMMIDFGRTVNAQGLDGHAMILLNADGDPDTGERVHELNGVDLIIDLTPPNSRSSDRPGMGMGIRSTTYSPDPNDANARRLTVYDIDLAFGPTYAGRRMEFRFNRGVELPNTPPLFVGDQLVAKLVFVDVMGEVADETDSFAHELTAAKPSATADLRQAAVEDSDDPLMRDEQTDLRVMTWNISRGVMFARSDMFIRTFRAINPDVILFQEVPERNTATDIADVLGRIDDAPDSAKWNVIVGEGGGDLRCAIATRLRLHAIGSLRLIPFPDQPDRTMRFVGATIEHDNRKLLALSVHLRCCGRAGGPEDVTRLLEVRTLNAMLEPLMSGGAVDALVIGGDFNLVGSRDPLEIMVAGLDRDGSSLTVVDALQPDGLSNATWSDPRQPFAPGRLDFLLFADATMGKRGAFVYDSRDLSPQWLERHGVLANDTTESSDHFPIVVDLHWVEE